MKIEDLIKKEGWEIKDNKVIAEGETFKICHPLSIHLKIYRESKNPDKKYQHMKAAHDYLWSREIFHSWTERRFRAHCEGYNYITYAGGASCAKSRDAAKIAFLFWLGAPKERAVIIASTTLESLHNRIWGYLITLWNESDIKIPAHYFRSSPPKILIDKRDTLHGIFSTAAKQGDDDRAIASIIGRHPKKGMLLVLDECTDMPMALLKALPNLEAGLDVFQCMGIGNSLSKNDLHGVLSTPKTGWNSIDPLTHIEWPTTQKNGRCLFFSCYESPRVHEHDPIKKASLRFLIGKEEIEEKKKLYGSDSDAFWRFVLGFWRTSSSDDIVISREFINEFGVYGKAEWSGAKDLRICAGLDPAFSTGGDQCVLRLGLLGVDVTGKTILDFKKEALLFRIKIIATSGKSAELQIADQVIEILNKFNCPLSTLVVDSNGQGRSLTEVLRLRGHSLRSPWKIYSIGFGNNVQKSFDVTIKSSYELWTAFRGYIQHGQIKGIDEISLYQLTTRQVELNKKTHKPQLESKIKFKARMGGIMPSLARSPDEADALSLCLQSAILNYGFKEGETMDLQSYNDEHDIKYWIHKKEIQMVEEVHSREELIANFTGEIGAIKSGLGD